MGQTVLCNGSIAKELRRILKERNIKKLLLICGSSFERLPIRSEIEALPVETVRFSGFTPNPRYEEVCEGADVFRREGCDGILAVGGGSAMDVAKCVKLFCRMEPSENYLRQNFNDTGVPLIAVPTTAGTGSEATRFAVIYHCGEKQSVTHDSILPDHALLEPGVLEELPALQRKCALLDALCQGIEAWWSVNSTEESKKYSREAIEKIAANWRAYIEEGRPEAAVEMMAAANLAGRAIDIARTTAPHAMSYKLTALYGLPHGHAVAVCLPEVWAYMQEHIEKCGDVRGARYLKKVFAAIARALGCEDETKATEWLRSLLKQMGLSSPVAEDRERDLKVLVSSVNLLRLQNNPVPLDSAALTELYERIVK